MLLSIQGTIGRVALVPEGLKGANISRTLARLSFQLPQDGPFYRHWLLSGAGRKAIDDSTVGTTRSSLNLSVLRQVTAPSPPAGEKATITHILDTLDAQIRRTEELIAKLEQIKQGLLTDLLTRGIDENGQLRPPPDQAPHLYKDSPLGRIPREWEMSRVSAVVESAVDGPFGSNLKTEHYVEYPGVRVVRLQNVKPGWYDDTDRAFITSGHAKQLARNEVLPGDLLVAGLGEETHPLGRACLYPQRLLPAVNKADCYRLRGLRRVARNEYIMHFLNSATAAEQVRRYQQGVTLQRINLSNLRELLIPIMSSREQDQICTMLRAASRKAEAAERELGKLRRHKAGLMDDLLTGRVRVTALLDKAERAAS
jgi:type I restriction enzyme S subunit